MLEPFSIVGRQSSHFSRVVRIFTEELVVPYTFKEKSFPSSHSLDLLISVSVLKRDAPRKTPPIDLTMKQSIAAPLTSVWLRIDRHAATEVRASESFAQLIRESGRAKRL